MALLVGLAGRAGGLENPGFESGENGRVPVGWLSPTEKAGYRVERVSENPVSGGACARLSGSKITGGAGFGNVMQEVDPASFSGKRVRLTGFVRVSEGSRAQMWLRVDMPDGRPAFFENMDSRPILVTGWKQYDVVGKVPVGAAKIALGVILVGTGTAWVDDMRLESLGAIGEGDIAPMPLGDRGLDNLVAFGRLLGYVRFFHPSDEAAAADWDSVAIEGVRYVESARTPEELATRLAELFVPLAPTLSIWPEGSKEPAIPVPAMLPPDHFTLSWRHHGVGLHPESVYRSVRVDDRTPPASRILRVTQTVDGSTLSGKSVVLKGVLRAFPGRTGVVKLAVSFGADASRIGEKAGGKLAASEDYRRYEIKVAVPKEANWVSAEVRVGGEASVLVDDLFLGAEDGVNLLRNPGFEEEPIAGFPPSFEAPERPLSTFNKVEVVPSGQAHSGARALRIVQKALTLPSPKERFHASLPGGVAIALPLSVYATERGTIPPATERMPQPADRPRYWQPTAGDRATRLADVILAWNVLQHFFPYFDVVHPDWMEVLRTALKSAATDNRPEDFGKTLRRMMAHLEDGHAMVRGVGDPGRYRLPINWDIVEGRLVITATTPDAVGVAVGDVVRSIDGRDPEEVVAEASTLVSGATPQWIRRRVLAIMLHGNRSEDACLELLKSGGSIAQVQLARQAVRNRLAEQRPEPNADLGHGIRYVDLTRLDDAAFDKAIGRLVAAKGIIFDLRGYPRISLNPVAHLIDKPVTCARWHIPIVTRPDQGEMTFEFSNWSVEPQTPRFRGRVAFLTDSGAVSYGETYMGIVEAYRLGEIVGGTTAGTNGNINIIKVPGGIQLIFTGMRVLKHDGSRHHGIGIRPTIPVNRTIRAIQSGKDEVLATALEVVGKP